MTTDENSGKARVRGLEFNYTQQFTFLPGALRGLGAFANYTWLQSEGSRQTVGGTTSVSPAAFGTRLNFGVSSNG